SWVVEVSSGVDGLARLGRIERSRRGLVASEPDRGLALGTGFLGKLVGRGGLGRALGTKGLVIGPTITLGGTIFGAGAGMEGCLSPPESETDGAFLVG